MNIARKPDMAHEEDPMKEQSANEGHRPPPVNDREKPKEDQEDSVRIRTLFQGFFELLPDGAIIVNSRGEIVHVNAELERMFGYKRDEIIGKSVDMLVPERIASGHAEDRKRYLSEPRRRPMGTGLELHGRRKDGAEFPVDISLNPIRLGEDMVVIGVVRDYTWRKRGEEAVYRLAAIVESSADAIIGKTLDDIIFSWNAGAEKIYGYSSEEVIGKSVSILIPPDRLDESPEFLERLRRGGRIENYETVCVRKDGKQIHISMTVSPIIDSGGSIIGASTITRDITDRKRAEEEIRRVNEKLEQLYESCEATNKELETFSYSASHDLRTPLVAIGGLARSLLENDSVRLDEKGREFLSAIFKKTDQMRQLIDGLLAFSRSGREALKESHIDMNDLAKNVIEELKLVETGRVLQVNLRSLPPIRGDQMMVRQVLMNLLSNAMKFTRPKPTAMIEIGAKEEDRVTTYYVKDNGVGFDAADASKLFEVFKRLHRPQEFEGTGVGLAIVWRIIQRHGGRVWAEGENGEGATFYFSLPR